MKPKDYAEWDALLRDMIDAAPDLHTGHARAVGALQMLLWVHAPDESWAAIRHALDYVFHLCNQHRCLERAVGEDGLCAHHDRLANRD